MLEHIHLKSRAMNKRKYLTQSKLNHKVRFNNIKKTSKSLNLNKNKLINKLKYQIEETKELMNTIVQVNHNSRTNYIEGVLKTILKTSFYLSKLLKNCFESCQENVLAVVFQF